jgi:predicted TIM-barrel fold metal-dependent hydrolase
MTVDSHVHVIGDAECYPLRPTSLVGDSWYRASPVDVARLAALMDEASVEHAVLVQAVGAYSDDNSYVLDAAATDPDRFAAVVMVDPHSNDPGSTLRRCVERGAGGVRIFAVRDRAGSVDAAAYRPLWDEAAVHGLPVVVTVWTKQLPGVAAMAAAYPDLTVAIDHCGFPTFPDGLGPILELAAIPNLSVKATAHLLHDAAAAGVPPESVLTTLVQSYGAPRVIWGSDFPQTWEPSYPELVEEGRRAAAPLAEKDRDLIFGGNARRLWWPVSQPAPG